MYRAVAGLNPRRSMRCGVRHKRLACLERRNFRRPGRCCSMHTNSALDAVTVCSRSCVRTVRLLRGPRADASTRSIPVRRAGTS